MKALDFILPRTPDGAVDVDHLRRMPPIDATSEGDLMTIALKLCAKDLPDDGKPIAAAQAMLATLEYMAHRLSLTSAQLREAIVETVRKTQAQRHDVHVVHAQRGDVVFFEIL
jgi:hypothetical protein